MQKIKKILNIICYYLLPIGLVIGSLIVSGKGIGAENDLYSTYGSAAMMLLLIILFSKPISQIAGHLPLIGLVRYIVAFRRQIGVAAFWLALFHGLLYIRFYELFSLQSYLGEDNKLYLFGLVAMIGMVILGITSNNISVKLLKKNWKRLHYIVYAVFFFALLHVAEEEGDGYAGAIFMTLLFITLKILAHKKIKLFPSFGR